MSARVAHIGAAVLGIVLLAVSACADDSVPRTFSRAPTPVTGSPLPEPTPTPEVTPSATEGSPEITARPAWLGTRVLPKRPDGLGEIQDTPPELTDRRLPPPNADPIADEFTATIEPVPAAVVARSTWTGECPVELRDLRYLTMAFWGFDDRTHAGELIVHADVADDVVAVFQQLYDARFPIEEMRVVRADELDDPPTGDGNNTTAFVCRPTTLGHSWSEHALGLAVDINPFHNPFHRGDAVVPELASAYLDRDWDRPGMIQPGDVVTEAFAAIGWGWGGQWRSLRDWMHFSQSGR